MSRGGPIPFVSFGVWVGRSNISIHGKYYVLYPQTRWGPLLGSLLSLTLLQYCDTVQLYVLIALIVQVHSKGMLPILKIRYNCDQLASAQLLTSDYCTVLIARSICLRFQLVFDRVFATVEPRPRINCTKVCSVISNSFCPVDSFVWIWCCRTIAVWPT